MVRMYTYISSIYGIAFKKARKMDDNKLNNLRQQYKNITNQELPTDNYLSDYINWLEIRILALEDNRDNLNNKINQLYGHK